MKAEALIALFAKLLDERLESLGQPVAGQRGLRGPRGVQGEPGSDGQAFDFEAHAPQIKSWAKEFALKFSDLTPEEISALTGPRGRDGRDGRDFDFSAHADTIKAWVSEQRLKFEDLTPDQIHALTGSRGRDGRDFNFEEHADQIRAWVTEQKLKFSDFTAEEISELRGPRGRDGRQGLNGADGKDFSFADHREEIGHILAETVASLSPDLKLKFSDLTDDDKFALKGARGQRGKAGKDFVFAEHEEFFKSLKPTFQDFSAEERESLKLHFKDLTDAERDTLRLKFENLTDDERLLIKGARGQRGKAGRDGVDGAQGPAGQDGRSVRGMPGPMGIKGLPGQAGIDGLAGRDGEDAPRVTDVSIVQRRGDFAFVFTFDDGSEIRTNYVSYPAANVYVAGGGIVSGSGGGSGGTGTDGQSAYQLWLALGNAGTEQDFIDSLRGADGTSGRDGLDGEPGNDGAHGAQGEPGFPGVDGKSAYAIWLDQGNTGTESDFIASLKGPKGDSGSGLPGEDANQVLRDVPCSSDVYISSCVRMSESDYIEGHMAEWASLASVVQLRSGTYTSKAVNAIASNYRTSNVIGIVVAKSSPVLCDVRIAGIAQGIFYGLDVAEEYYLSDDDPGRIVSSTNAPQANEHVFLKVGQPTAFDSLLFLRGERLVRSALADPET